GTQPLVWIPIISLVISHSYPPSIKYSYLFSTEAIICGHIVIGTRSTILTTLYTE
ncbi:unnamed protein product, partial [Sphenostylis stenocarpa]